MATRYGPAHDASPAFAINPAQPPAPPPKPSGHDASRRGTPAGGPAFPAPAPGRATDEQPQPGRTEQIIPKAAVGALADPGENWLPALFEHMSKQDVAEALQDPKLISALTHAPSTAHPSTAAFEDPLQAALSENTSLADHLAELEGRLARLRESTQAQLLAAHALERQWRQKQLEMDRALSPFSPSSLYQRLNQGVQEQEMVCRALEDSFLDGDGDVASEREITDWVKRYREAKKTYYARKERKERWDEGRVGGWR